ncbi:MAG TPA: hypothetical protein VEH31_42455 [Streptosporangiaceae bacterium]|nr:hypothetical protein [Streptosporangiaceae bacterium]
MQLVDNSLKALVSHLVAYSGPWSWFAIKYSWVLVLMTMLVFAGLAYLTSARSSRRIRPGRLFVGAMAGLSLSALVVTISTMAHSLDSYWVPAAQRHAPHVPAPGGLLSPLAPLFKAINSVLGVNVTWHALHNAAVNAIHFGLLSVFAFLAMFVGIIVIIAKAHTSLVRRVEALEGGAPARSSQWSSSGPSTAPLRQSPP